MKKKLLICVLPFLFTLTGCAQKFDYTPEQSAATAEYMAGLLLKYASNYQSDLLTEEELIQNDNDAAAVTAAPTEVPEQNVAADEKNSETGAGETEASAKPLKEVSLSEVIGTPGFELQYKDYSLKDFYPENATKEVFSITPRQGYQLAVISFELSNQSNAKGEIKLTTPQYQLNINQGVLYEPQLSLLENDLKYLDMKVAKGESEAVLLIYEVKKDEKITSMSLTVTNEDKTATVNLK